MFHDVLVIILTTLELRDKLRESANRLVEGFQLLLGSLLAVGSSELVGYLFGELFAEYDVADAVVLVGLNLHLVGRLGILVVVD